MSRLWLKLSEETNLPAALTPAERTLLQGLFDFQDKHSLWCQAASDLGFPLNANIGELLSWHQDTPYIDWSGVVQTVSCGLMEIAPTPDRNYTYRSKNSAMGFLRLVRSQFKLESTLAQALDAPPPSVPQQQIAQSTLLGLAILALTLRLPAHSAPELASWLADPASAPRAVQATIQKMLAAQTRRNALSPAWSFLFPPRADSASSLEMPAFFWEGETPRTADPIVPGPAVTSWNGIPVCHGQVSGPARIVTLPLDHAESSTPQILIFARAKPETTEVFHQASALLFAEGGVLSHACSIAREQGIPCVTGLGRGFFAQMQARTQSGQRMRLGVDATSGTVTLE